MEQPTTTIDKILNININPENYTNEFNALTQLKIGMIALYNNVRPIEVQIRETQGEISFFGHPDLAPPEIPCFFIGLGAPYATTQD